METIENGIPEDNFPNHSTDTIDEEIHPFSLVDEINQRQSNWNVDGIIETEPRSVLNPELDEENDSTPPSDSRETMTGNSDIGALSLFA